MSQPRRSQPRRGGGAGAGGGGQGRAQKSGPGQLPVSYAGHVLAPLFGDRTVPWEPLCPNPGLVFDRYLRVWQSRSKLVVGSGHVLTDFVGEYGVLGRTLGALLAETHRRLEQLTSHQRSFLTEARLVSGLGASHPLENGFCFDYTIGVPSLPGSSVKGLCRQIAGYELDERTLRAVFGAADEDGIDPDASASVGDMVFFAAYPKGWPKLEVDIINCQYPRYYSKQPPVLPQTRAADASPRTDEPPPPVHLGPREDESPVPVFFLTVARGTAFVFRVLSRSGNEKNVGLAFELLSAGLHELGIGAKTALGYGVMAPC